MANVAQVVWDHAAATPDRVALRSLQRDITFGELRTASSNAAAAFRAAGLDPLDTVVLIAPSVLAFPVVYYGLQAAGITVITMNTMATPAEVGYVVDDADVKGILVWHESSQAAEQVAQRAGIPLWRIDEDANYETAPLAQLHSHDLDATALILYTSGTTGHPKGVEITVANMAANAEALKEVLALSDADRFGTALPLFHVYGQVTIMHALLSTGACLTLLPVFDAAQMLTVMKDHDLTGVAGVPTMWNAMLHAAEGHSAADFASLRVAMSGAAPLPVEIIRAFETQFECRIAEGYALTESAGAATFNHVQRDRKVGTVGQAVPHTLIEIRDEKGAVLPTGQPGEVFLKGPTIMKGYRNKPEATAADVVDGWLKTGDIGQMDDEGYLSIVDRAKDLIIRGGYNVYPREVEEVLYTHPDIVEAAVVGIPDQHYGEEVAAVITLRSGSTLDGPAIREWAKQELSAYKVPRVFSFVDALPKGPTGKILKREIDRDRLTPSRDKETRA